MVERAGWGRVEEQGEAGSRGRGGQVKRGKGGSGAQPACCKI